MYLSYVDFPRPFIPVNECGPLTKMHNDAATIEKETANCKRAFQHVVKRTNVPSEYQEKVYQEIQSALYNHLKRFELWSRNAAIGQPGAVSLEDRLKRKGYITEYILNCLRDLKECLAKGELVRLSC